MKNKMIVKAPDQAALIVELEEKVTNDLIHKLVGGYFQIVPVRLPIKRAVMLCDEEGKLKDYDYNFTIMAEGIGVEPYDHVVGTVIILGAFEDDLDGLTIEEATKLKSYFDWYDENIPYQSPVTY